MTRRLQWIIGGIALLVILLSIALQAEIRLRLSHRFGQPHQVRTNAGTNYVVRLSETTLGRVGSSYALVVFLNVENPNPAELTLNRNDFILVDESKNYFLPATTGTQQAAIKVPPGGARDDQMLSFAVGAETLRGTIGLQIGHYYWVALKSEKPYTPNLRPDEFRSFKQVDWHN